MKVLDLKIPSHWNQLTQKQILFVCRLFLMNLTEQKFKLYTFTKFTGIHTLPEIIKTNKVYYSFRKKRVKFLLTIEELNSFLKSTDYLLNDSKLTINRFPEFNILGKNFYGPSNNGYNITFLEFINLESCIYAFHKTRETKNLKTLCAILYRPQKKNYKPNSPSYNGDRREQFNDYTYQHRARWFRFLKKEKLYAVYTFYIGCRNALVEAHPNLFSGGSVKSEQTNPVKDLQKTLFSLNRGDITKNKEIQQIQVWEAFSQLEEMVIQAKRKGK